MILNTFINLLARIILLFFRTYITIIFYLIFYPLFHLISNEPQEPSFIFSIYIESTKKKKIKNILINHYYIYNHIFVSRLNLRMTRDVT